jgi:hypothetical protein
MALEFQFRQRVECAGGHFLGLRAGIVYFAAAPGEKVLSLFAFACTNENVSLTLKAFRENLAHDAWASLV